MMPNNHVPRDIPWKLAATTMELQPAADPPSVPPGSSIALLTHVPDLPNLEDDYPDHRLVYFRFAVTISPDAHSFEGAEEFKPLVAEGLPVWSSVADIRISPNPDPESGFEPYFIAAAPLRRSMVETGVVGDDRYEGESKGLSMSRTGTSLTETFWSNTETGESTSGWSVDLSVVGFGGGERTTTTGITGGRGVTQTVDVTQRNASEERRELISSYTNVRNILSLMTTKHIGSPYLRFLMRPRPLRTLFTGPPNPDIWYDQFLRRRSRGIEGMQDLFGVAVVPRGAAEFCVSITLRNVYVYADPPVPPTKLPRFTMSDLDRVEEYVNQRYPPGTPVDEIDIDMIDPGWIERCWSVVQFRPFLGSGRHVSEDWYDWGYFSAYIASPQRWAAGEVMTGRMVGYKRVAELWLEMHRARYQADLIRSPLERGVVFYVPHTLQVCFRLEDGVLQKDGEPQVEPAGDPIILSDARPPRFSPYVPFESIYVQSPIGRQVFLSDVTAWNQLDDALHTNLAARKTWAGSRFSAGNPEVADVMLRHMEKLPPGEPLNQRLDEAAAWLGLSDEDLEALKAAGVTDVRTLAMTIIHAADDAARRQRKARLAELLSQEGEPPLEIGEEDRRSLARLGERIEERRASLPQEKVEELRKKIAKGLSAAMSPPKRERGEAREPPRRPGRRGSGARRSNETLTE